MYKLLAILLCFLTLSVYGQTYIQAPALYEGVTLTATAAGTTTLTISSQTNQVFTGSAAQTVTLPDATTIAVGRRFFISNESTGLVTINANGGGLIKVLGSMASTEVRLKTNSVAAGTWNIDDGNMPSTTFTLGSMIFAGVGGVLSQDNANLFWDNTNKRLGIGTATPGRALQVELAAIPGIRLQRNDSTQGNGVIEFTGNDGAVDASIVYNNLQSTSLTFNTGGATLTNTRMLIAGSGNIGVGNEVSPASRLHLNDSGATALAVKLGNSNTGLTSTDGFNFGIATTGVGEIRQYENLDIGIFTNNTERSRFLSGGNVNFLNGVTFSAALGNVVSNGAGIDNWNGTMSMIVGGDNNANTRTDLTTKIARIGSFHYTNAEEPVSVLVASNSSGSNALTFGGGSAVFNAATSINFNTATNSTTTTGTTRLSILSTGSVLVGDAVNTLSTSATSGFLYLPTSAGTPTGTPTSITGAAPIEIDTTNNQLMFYSGGSWRTSDQAAFYVNATMEGGNFNLGAASVSSYTEITNSDIALTPISGSSAVGVMCSGTNAATSPSTSPTTCAAGSESLGINFTIPKAGVYEVCSYFSHTMTADSGVVVISTFQLIETPTNAQTLTLEGGSKMASGLVGMTIATGVNQVSHNPNTNCSVFNWTGKSNGDTVGVRLMYEQFVSGTPDDSVIYADGSASFGQRNVRWTVRRF